MSRDVLDNTHLELESTMISDTFSLSYPLAGLVGSTFFLLCLHFLFVLFKPFTLDQFSYLDPVLTVPNSQQLRPRLPRTALANFG